MVKEQKQQDLKAFGKKKFLVTLESNLVILAKDIQLKSHGTKELSGLLNKLLKGWVEKNA